MFLLTIKSVNLAPRPRLGVPRLDALTLDHIVTLYLNVLFYFRLILVILLWCAMFC